MRLLGRFFGLPLIILGITILGLIFVQIFFSIMPKTFAEEGEAQLISEQHFVTIHDQEKNLTIKTDAKTVQEALDRADILVDENDIIEPELTSFINADNYHINIHRSRPVIVMDGVTNKYIMTASYDPHAIAEEAGFSVYDGDKIELVANSYFLEAGNITTYKLTRNGGRTVTIESTISYTEETVQDKSLDVGKTELRQVGEDGRKITKYQVNFKDGKEVSREIIGEEVIVQPTARVTAIGAKPAVPPEWETCASWVRAAGVSEADLSAALSLIYHESGCRVNATNASSGAYGIPQALPGHKMASAGADWQTNPITQIRWMAGYVNRYGGWQGALNHWSSRGWY